MKNVKTIYQVEEFSQNKRGWSEGDVYNTNFLTDKEAAESYYYEKVEEAKRENAARRLSGIRYSVELLETYATEEQLNDPDFDDEAICELFEKGCTATKHYYGWEEE